MAIFDVAKRGLKFGELMGDGLSCKGDVRAFGRLKELHSDLWREQLVNTRPRTVASSLKMPFDAHSAKVHRTKTTLTNLPNTLQRSTKWCTLGYVVSVVA